jgi:phage terminase large subunit-like protein
MEKVFISGVMIGSMMATGKIIRCMEGEYILGLTEENMKEIILTTKKRDTGCLRGLMAENMMENGKMASSMARELTKPHLETLREVNGKTGKELNGFLENETK